MSQKQAIAVVGRTLSTAVHGRETAGSAYAMQTYSQWCNDGSDAAVTQGSHRSDADRAGELRRLLACCPAADAFIYAIQAGEGGPVKIGLTTNPRERLATLQVGNHARLQGLAVWPGSAIEERLWHELFAGLRLDGEWFRPDPELLELVDFMGGPPNCEWHRETDCLNGYAGTCEACGIELFGVPSDAESGASA